MAHKILIWLVVFALFVNAVAAGIADFHAMFGWMLAMWFAIVFAVVEQNPKPPKITLTPTIRIDSGVDRTAVLNAVKEWSVRA